MSPLRRSGSATLPASATLLLLLLTSTCGRADVFRSADLRLEDGADPFTVVLEVRLPVAVDTGQAAQWPEGCELTRSEGRPIGEQRLLIFEATCRSSPWQPGAAIILPWALDGARLLRRTEGKITRIGLRPQNGRLLVPLRGDAAGQGGVASFGEALWQGMVHIAIGWDHLSFVLLLCLLVPVRQLLLLVTAFTLGHSVSLALAFYEILTLPIKPVEALIALSIVVLAREVLLARDGAHQMARPYLVVSSFGLLHGLGFASALDALGVSGSLRWPLLAGFNIGVEMGQVLFIGLILSILWLSQRLDGADPVRLTLTWGSGSIGAFWLWERILSVG